MSQLTHHKSSYTSSVPPIRSPLPRCKYWSDIDLPITGPPDSRTLSTEPDQNQNQRSRKRGKLNFPPPTNTPISQDHRDADDSKSRGEPKANATERFMTLSHQTTTSSPPHASHSCSDDWSSSHRAAWEGEKSPRSPGKHDDPWETAENVRGRD